MKVLVTGAGGYIGRHLVPRLRAEGYEVVETARENPDERPEWYGAVNLAAVYAVPVLLGAAPQVDTLIHLAGRVDIQLRPNHNDAHLPPIPGSCDLSALYRDNVVATANVLDYCVKANVRHLIFASTQAVYGWPERDLAWDHLLTQPLEHYAASKLAAEQMVELTSTCGLKTTILRLPGVYGGARKAGAVYGMCRSAVREGRVAVTSPYPLPITVLHMEDAVGAIVAACARRQDWLCETIDVTDGAPCSLPILAQEIGLLAGCRVDTGTIQHPIMHLSEADARICLDWHPKPRKERLLQMLEEIRRGS